MARRGQPAMTTQSFDQYLVDYTVRNITTGDDEDIRVLELTDAEIDRFPAEVREQVAVLIAAGRENPNEWVDHQDYVLANLLSYITDRALYDSDYGLWEINLLQDADTAVTDIFPPEHVSGRVR